MTFTHFICRHACVKISSNCQFAWCTTSGYKICYRFSPSGAILSYSINPFNPPPVLWTCYLVIPDCCGGETLESLCCPQGRKLQWSSIKFGSHSAPLDQACLSQTQPVAIMSGQIITDIQNVNFKLILCLTMSPLQHPDKGCIFKEGEKNLNSHRVASFTYARQVFSFQLSTGNSPTWLQPIVQLNNLAFFHLSQLKTDYWEHSFPGLLLLNTRFSANTSIFLFNTTFLHCKIIYLSRCFFSLTCTQLQDFYLWSCISLPYFSHIDRSQYYLLLRKKKIKKIPGLSSAWLI